MRVYIYLYYNVCKKKMWELFIVFLYEEFDLEIWNNLGYFKCILYFEKGFK